MGNRWIHRANFNSNINLRPWWRVNMSSDLSFVKVSGKRVNTQFSTFSLGANNNLILRNDLIIRLNTSLNNGDSSSYGVPNDFIRVYASASVTKKFLSDQLQVIAQVHDIFGTGNRKENSYTIGSTTYTSRNTIQRPSVSLNISYRFASGSKISKKNKKASHVDGSRF
ncbi:hypothetical protein DN748_01530 [Sinomicrobium soli]|nr:hypothetical protein DN748_01530 [Sinomicrobium sp. N-1-3-6]